MILYLTVEQVLFLHRLQVGQFGGASGLRDRPALEAAVARPQATFGGEDLYPDVESKAAALMHSLVAGHPFVDGNKRVGAHAALVFLHVNDVTPAFAPADLTELTFSVARGEVSAEALAIWLRQRTRPSSER